MCIQDLILLSLIWSIREISNQFVISIFDCCVSIRFAVQSELPQCVRCFTSFPQFLLPYRYEILDLISYVVDPSLYVELLPVFLDTQAIPEDGVFITQNDKVIRKVVFSNNTQVEWFETTEILQFLQSHPVVQKDDCISRIVTETLTVQREIIPASRRDRVEV